MIYLDTTAIIKLVRREPESDALGDWLDDRLHELLLTSALAEVEVPRGLRRSEPALLQSVPPVMARLAICDIDEVVRATAAGYADPLLRSLDAVHLATAQVFGGRDLAALVTYDKRLLAAADALGVPTAAPGT
ncbi:MAG: type II toxin-antitoxin system VapC family toxin [Micromonosporaceae bacterium]